MPTPSGITLVGLGPGSPELLTRQAWDVLEHAAEVYVLTEQHPVISILPPQVQVYSFDHLYQQSDSLEKVMDEIVTQVISLGHRLQGVIYASPGHPCIAEKTSLEIFRRGLAEGLPVRIIEGVSVLEAVRKAMVMPLSPYGAWVEAIELAQFHHPHFSPASEVIITSLQSPSLAAQIKRVLCTVYPADYPVKLIHFLTAERRDSSLHIEDVLLGNLDQCAGITFLSHLYLPPLGTESSFEGFQDIIAHLRAPDGCPWDRQQTHQTLRSHLLSETYEVLEALDLMDAEMLREELGDLLLQIVLHAQIAYEAGEFNMGEVLRGIHTKIVHRHPHVFGGLEVKDVQGVLRNWEQLKADERNSKNHSRDFLDGVPKALPALIQTQEFQERAARLGYALPEINGVISHIVERLEALQQATDAGYQKEQIGDILFAIGTIASHLNLDAESALREANNRFRQRLANKST